MERLNDRQPLGSDIVEELAAGTQKPTAPPADSSDSAWATLAQNLAADISKMERDQFLSLTVAAPADGGEYPSYYVQFACGGDQGFRVEAVSNRFLADRWKLSEKTAELLFQLGWHAPEPDTGPHGKVNYWTHWPAPVASAPIAQLAVTTLRRVYRVASPERLEYRYFAKGGEELELAVLGLRREASKRVVDDTVERLRPIVEQALRDALRVSELRYDERGDILIRFGSAMVLVRLVGGKTPEVRVFSPLLWELSSTDGLTEVLNDINMRASFGRVFWTGKEVIAAVDLPAAGISGEYIALACFEIGSLADHFDEELVERFGGKTMFGAAKTIPPYQPPGYL